MSKVTPKFKCRIDGGQLRYENHIRDVMDSYIKSLPDGFYSTSIKKFTIETDRSIAQNAYYWALCEIFSEYNGDTKDGVHLLFKDMFLGFTKEVGGVQYRVIPSTTELTTEKFEKYLAEIIEWCAPVCKMPLREDIDLED